MGRFPLKPAYVAWIAANVEGDGYGKCRDVSENMAAAFPELKQVRGWYDCPLWGARSHWWCRTEDGTIVDPTAAQFPSAGIFNYRELDESNREQLVPAGTCPNCGGAVYVTLDKAEEGEIPTVCSERCHGEYLAYCNSGL
jgi:hypothetical protein